MKWKNCLGEVIATGNIWVEIDIPAPISMDILSTCDPENKIAQDDNLAATLIDFNVNSTCELEVIVTFEGNNKCSFLFSIIPHYYCTSRK